MVNGLCVCFVIVTVFECHCFWLYFLLKTCGYGNEVCSLYFIHTMPGYCFLTHHAGILLSHPGWDNSILHPRCVCANVILPYRTVLWQQHKNAQLNKLYNNPRCLTLSVHSTEPRLHIAVRQLGLESSIRHERRLWILIILENKNCHQRVSLV